MPLAAGLEEGGWSSRRGGRVLASPRSCPSWFVCSGPSQTPHCKACTGAVTATECRRNRRHRRNCGS